MIEVDPQVAPLTNRGIAYDRKCDKAHALADYSEAIRLDPSQPESYINRAEPADDRGLRVVRASPGGRPFADTMRRQAHEPNALALPCEPSAEALRRRWRSWRS
jgi:hypothetical protein